MKKVLVILLLVNLSLVCYSQLNQHVLGFNITPGSSSFIDHGFDYSFDEIISYYEPVFSPGIDVNYSFQRNSFTFGIAVGVEVLRVRFISLMDSISIDDNPPEYIGLETNTVLSQYLVHVSPFVRWNFRHVGRTCYFLEMQPGAFNRTYAVSKSVSHFQAIYEDTENTEREWYSDMYKPVSFSLAVKLGIQYYQNARLAFSFAAFYRNYLTPMRSDHILGINHIYYKYGLEAGLKINLD